MTLFIKPYRIVASLVEQAKGLEADVFSGKWIEFESSMSIEGTVIPVTAIVMQTIRPNKHEEWLLRPCDFEKARDWVFDTSIISRDDKPQLIWLLNTMEDDAEIYLQLSW